jgi:low temperature requirement protein LtrA
VATGTSEEEGPARRRRLSAVRREAERVKPLELFFDLVFVLALTQCTALMADEPTWEGLLKGLVVLGLLWWAWVGYTWFTSVVDPEEGAVRLIIFGAMAAFLVVSLCIPQAFGGLGMEFAVAYGIARYLQLGLFWVASSDEPELRRSVISGLLFSTTIGIALLIAGSQADGDVQIALWGLALALDMAGPLLFGSEGWQLSPEHFAERHGLILIIALGESILVAARRLERAEPGREQNEMARDSYSFLHLPMVAGIVLVALGLKKTLEHVDDPLKLVPAIALLGGVAAYLLAHVAFRWRNVHTLNRQRLGLAVLCLALVPVAVEIPALASVTIVTALLAALIAVETHRYGEARERVRRGLYAPPA